MCSCSISTRSLLGSLATILFVSVVGSDANLINSAPPRVSTVVADSREKSSILVPVSQAQTLQPTKPRSPDCFMFFPGTPGWNDCFRKFTQEMANYQEKMHAYVKTQAQVEGGSNGESSYTRLGPGGYYSGSQFLNSNSMSTSNSYTGGYAIHATNMALSTSLINNVVKITLHTGPIDKFDTKTHGNEITINVVSKGMRKWAKILVPKGLKISDVKVERSSDAIYISGPTLLSDGGNFQMSQSEGSSFGSGGFSDNYAQSGPIPAVPMPEFQNMFQNMFQNFFANMFGGRSLPVSNGHSQKYYSSPYWFF